MSNRSLARAIAAGILAIVGLTPACGRSPSAPSPGGPPPVVIPLSVTTISPVTGSTGGGASMTITGTGFKPGVVAIFDGSIVSGRFQDQQAFTTLSVETPPHAAGAVDVVVTNLDGASVRVSSGYVYVSAESFDLNGPWWGVAHDGSDRAVEFTIQNNMLVAASCGYEVWVPLPFSSPSPVSNGEFSSYRADGIGMSGRIVSASEILGTMNFGVCSGMTWRAKRRSPSASTVRSR